MNQRLQPTQQKITTRIQTAGRPALTNGIDGAGFHSCSAKMATDAPHSSRLPRHCCYLPGLLCISWVELYKPTSVTVHSRCCCCLVLALLSVSLARGRALNIRPAVHRVTAVDLDSTLLGLRTFCRIVSLIIGCCHSACIEGRAVVVVPAGIVAHCRCHTLALR